ncbi:MAG: response regulator [Planctomycetaceae bacterium]|nr:response regulator [Planctomycetaceae bacterium]
MSAHPPQSAANRVIDSHDSQDRRVIGGRYELLRPLNSEHESDVFLASDRAAGTSVVVKLMRASVLSASARMRLEHEADVLSRIGTGVFAPLLDCGDEGDLVYLVMPFVPGITLQQRLQQGPLPVMDALTVGCAILNALSEAHAHEVLHRNVKPANVIVNEGTFLREATLIDFSIARSARLDASIRDQWIGTAQYMSPEGAGLLDQEVTACSDLYSTGIVLFECLAGRPPFAGENVGEVLRQHMTVQPPKLRGLGLSVPRVLDEVVQRLLRKDPRDRYQAAEAVATDLTVIAEALQRGESEPTIVVGIHDRRQTLTEPAFVGRDQELETLSSQLENAQTGRSGVVLLEAESGGGKSRLLAEFAQHGAQQGVWILRGQGLDQAAQRPFQLLIGVAEGLVSAARLELGMEEKFRVGLGDQREAACSALPELANLFGISSTAQLGPEEHGEARSVQALTTLLDAVGKTGRPVLVLLDDCQWADELTIRVLSNWQRQSENTERPILVVAAFRSEEVAFDHPLRALNASAHLKLRAFPASNVRKLVESMAGPLPDEAVAVIERLAEGSPFMAAAAVRGLVESGALIPQRASASSSEAVGAWRVEPSAMADVQSSRHAAAFLSKRIGLLPENTLKLLSIGAVLGKEFDLFTASKLARQSSAQAIAAMHEAQQRHIIWAKAKNDLCAFLHDKLRQTLLDRMPERELKESHLRAALYLAADAPGQVYDLAYHFDAAGESERALPFALAAADDARTHHALELAEQQYRIAQRGVPDADEVTRYRIAEGLGDVLMLRGRYQAAAQWFEAASFLAKDDMGRAEIEGKLGILAFKEGDNTASCEALERSIRLLGRRIPSHTAGFLAGIAWEALVQALHTIFPKQFLARRSPQDAEKELRAIDLLVHLSRVYFFERGKVPCLWAHLRSFNLAERYPPTVELGSAWAAHAPIMSVVPWLSRGEVYAKKSLDIRKDLGDECGQGQSLNYLGVVLFAWARYDECISVSRQAVRLCERTGDYWERNIAWYSIANALYRKGDLESAVAEAQQLYRECSEMGDDKASGLALDVWSRASGGRVPVDITQQEIGKERNDVWASALVLLAEAVRLVELGELAEAGTVLKHAYEVGRKLGMNAWVGPILPWLATTHRLQWEAAKGLVPHRRAELLDSAHRFARKALSVARKFQTDLPHALRESGLVAAMNGSLRKARRHLDESLSVAERQGARFEHAQTLLARGRVGLEVGWPGAAEDVASARETLRTLGADFALDDASVAEAIPTKTATLSLVDRFDKVLEAGRRIASALSRETVFQEVREAADLLLRGERCLLLRLQGEEADDDITKISGEIDAKYCRDMAERALATRQVIVLTEKAQAEEEGALLSGVRSALCAPVFVRGEPAGCFYVDHRNVSGLFGEDEKRLAEFIATIAGAALENAEGFAELQRLNATLEQRVADRTAAAESRARELAVSNAELERTATELRRSEDELRWAKEAAEQANRAKSDFLANMSHEIRTPMNGVMGMAELALQTSLTHQQQEYLNIVVQSADSLLRLLNDILDFSKVEAGKLELETIDFPLRDSLGDAMHTFGLRAAEKGVELNYLVPPDVPDTLVGDPGRLRQIIVNLVGNALKFTEQGEIVVAVTVEAIEESHVDLHFMVSDTGVGIPPDKLQKIFEAFGQADSSTTRRYGGTGLGLNISKQLVGLMNGELWVESEVGEGSEFHFTVRFGIAQGAPRHSWLKIEELTDMSVLVVVDNNTNRRILQDVLVNWGMRPSLAADGPAALAQLDEAVTRGDPFRLVLLDMMLQEMDGFMVAERVRQNPRLKDATFILLSSALSDHSARCQELGIAHNLIKPVKQSNLRETILRALSTEKVSAPQRVHPALPTGEARRALRILLADDGLINQKVARGLLERRGHQVVIANNGLEAVEAVEREVFDLVLMDVMMPEMDGFEATAAIRQREQTTGKHMQIVAMTAHALKGDRERCLKAGMDAYLSKPVQPKALYEMIEGITASAPAESESPTEPAPNNTIMNWNAAVEQIGGREDLLREVMTLFVSEADSYLTEIQEAIKREDMGEIRRLAHTIKGSAAHFAAQSTVAAAFRLEKMGHDGDLTGVDEAYATLESEVKRLNEAIANLLQI